MRISDWSSDVCSSDLLDDNAVRTLALRQPMANDLREVIAALKISSDIERIGDYAKNVAKRTIALNQLTPHEAARSIPRMAKLVKIGSASCRERVWQYELISVVAVKFKKNTITTLFDSLDH